MISDKNFEPKPLHNFRFWCQKVLPLVYDDSLSYYELLCKVVDYLNKVIDSQNNFIDIAENLTQSFEELKAYVDNYFESSDFQEIVNNKLDEFAEDGTLQQLIEPFLRFINRMGTYNLYWLGRTIRESPYKSAQGMCAITRNGRVEIITCYYNYSTPELSIVQRMLTDGTIIATSEALSLGHSNDIAYNVLTDSLFITGSGFIAELDYDSLTIKQVYTLTRPIQTLTFDVDNECYYSYYDGVIYRITNNFVNFEAIKEITFINPTVQGIEYWNGFLFITLNEPNMVATINVKGGFTLVDVSKVAIYASDFYPIGEVQNISIYNSDGDFIISGKPRVRDLLYNDVNVGDGITCFAQGNVIHNISSDARYGQVATNVFTYGCQINPSPAVFRPIGTASLPFNRLSEVSLVMENNQYRPENINVNADMPDEYAVFQNKVINFRTNGHVIKGLHLYNCTGRLSSVNLANSGNNTMYLLRCYLSVSNIQSASTSNVVVQSFITYVKAANDIFTNKNYSNEESIITVSGRNSFYTSVTLCNTLKETDGDLTVELNHSISDYDVLRIGYLRGSTWDFLCDITPGSFGGAQIRTPVLRSSNIADGFDRVIIQHISNTSVLLVGPSGRYRIVGIKY